MFLCLNRTFFWQKCFCSSEFPIFGFRAASNWWTGVEFYISLVIIVICVSGAMAVCAGCLSYW